MVSESRQPRAIVMINDIRVAWIDIEVNNNAYYQADSFRVTIPIKDQPSKIDRAWWASQDMMEVEIYTGLPPDADKYSTSDLDLLISARVDNCPHEMVSDVIVLTGRDYTADLIDTKTSDKWPMKTASAIAIAIANKYELTAGFVTPTKTKVGTYYDHDHAKLQMDMSEWDLLVWLASAEGFQIYVEGKNLHFEPRPTEPPIYKIIWADATANSIKKFKILFCQFRHNIIDDTNFIIIKIKLDNRRLKL